MPSFTDQMGHTIELDAPPRRVISLVPSQSEFLWDLGLREELVGVTRFCVHPQELKKNVTMVGGTKKLNLATITDLKPDLVIGNKEENSAEQIAALQARFPVWMSDIATIDDALQMMRQVGEMLEKPTKADELAEKVQGAMKACHNLFSGEKVAYFIWNKPYMLAGGRTFIDHLLTHAGFRNVASHLQRYPEVSVEMLKRLGPQYLLLSSEPFPFVQRHADELMKQLPGCKAVLVDGEMFSWYGTRLLGLPEYLERLKKVV